MSVALMKCFASIAFAGSLCHFSVCASEPERVAPLPVLLVHGIADNSHNMRGLARFLRSQGREVHLLDLTPNRGEVGLDELAGQVAAYVERHFSPGKKIDLVGFSMGGLVTRYYLQRLGGIDRVEHYVSVSAPHGGTALARLVANPGCRQMRPGSNFLRDLASDANTLRALKFTSLYTPLDLVILPARSSAMPQARNVRIPILLHPLMVWQPRALRTIEAGLRG